MYALCILAKYYDSWFYAVEYKVWIETLKLKQETSINKNWESECNVG